MRFFCCQVYWEDLVVNIDRKLQHVKCLSWGLITVVSSSGRSLQVPLPVFSYARYNVVGWLRDIIQVCLLYSGIMKVE